MRRKYAFLFTLLALASCTSNTIYKEPDNLIPKDTMVFLITDMIIASSSKNIKNKHLQKKINYMPLVYNKYKIDSTRFKESNVYYLSTIDVYEAIFKQVEQNLKTLQKKYLQEKKVQDSLKREKNKKLRKEFKEKGFSKKKKIDPNAIKNLKKGIIKKKQADFK